MDVYEVRHRNVRHLIALAGDGGLTKLADRLGKSQGQVSHFGGENPIKNIGPKIAREIEAAFDRPRGWLDSPHWSGIHEPVVAFDIRGVDGVDGVDFAKEVMIPEVDAELGAGEGVPAIEFIETRYRLPYQLEWLRSVGVRKPEDVRLMPVRGHSMERTLFDGDKVLVHITNKKIVSDAVFAIMLDGEPRIKRLFRSAEGIRVVSDNEDKLKYPDEIVTPEHGDRLLIIGRAIHRQGSKGL
jgi:SOS-response transcriptional repressor LexA